MDSSHDFTTDEAVPCKESKHKHKLEAGPHTESFRAGANVDGGIAKLNALMAYVELLSLECTESSSPRLLN